MNYSELDEDDEDLYEGLEADNVGSYEKKVEEKKVEKKEVEKVFPKQKEQLFEKSRKSLYKKLSGAKPIYTKKGTSSSALSNRALLLVLMCPIDIAEGNNFDNVSIFPLLFLSIISFLLPFLLTEPCVFLGAPQISEDVDVGEGKIHFLLLLNLLYFINDMTIKRYCEQIGKVKRVVILEDEHYCKSLGMCLVEFYYLDHSQNYATFLREKLKAVVRTLDINIEEQIKRDELYNYGGYLNYGIIELLKKEYSEFLHTSESAQDALNKPLSLNRHPLFKWFNTNLKDVLNTYVKSELKKKKKNTTSCDFMDQSDSNSDSESDISTHILEYASKKNRFLRGGKP
ncbi:conserved Plasmodium protein, unknown function [Plasmodium ovale curtisi]|uniref:Uncharacterized protein n=1 Tax=Plasmodium ovale curtisi TaxID=864141 RepID=A0A1A8W5B4_PLAOA|nr:conserved Plasmodium protein, unknown function [Plasmodium ovale curtisi]